MDEDASILDSLSLDSDSSELPGENTIEKQRATLQTYLNSLPYECESEEEMNQALEFIVGRIAICAEAKSWLVLTTWDTILQWFVLPVHGHL